MHIVEDHLKKLRRRSRREPSSSSDSETDNQKKEKKTPASPLQVQDPTVEEQQEPRPVEEEPLLIDLGEPIEEMSDSSVEILPPPVPAAEDSIAPSYADVLRRGIPGQKKPSADWSSLAPGQDQRKFSF